MNSVNRNEARNIPFVCFWCMCVCVLKGKLYFFDNQNSQELKQNVKTVNCVAD